VMSQRVNAVLSITQRMFRDGLWKNTAAHVSPLVYARKPSHDAHL
jgi:hypothetical protein